MSFILRNQKWNRILGNMCEVEEKLQICTCSSIGVSYFYLGLSPFHLPNRILCQRSPGRPCEMTVCFKKRPNFLWQRRAYHVCPFLYKYWLLVSVQRNTPVTEGTIKYVKHGAIPSIRLAIAFLSLPSPSLSSVHCLSPKHRGRWSRGNFHGKKKGKKTCSCIMWNYSKQAPRGSYTSHETSS